MISLPMKDGKRVASSKTHAQYPHSTIAPNLENISLEQRMEPYFIGDNSNKV